MLTTSTVTAYARKPQLSLEHHDVIHGSSVQMVALPIQDLAKGHEL